MGACPAAAARVFAVLLVVTSGRGGEGAEAGCVMPALVLLVAGCVCLAPEGARGVWMVPAGGAGLTGWLGLAPGLGPGPANGTAQTGNTTAQLPTN